ncbi:MAG: hypothetical protein ACKOSS_05300 [Planctomycetia bacterium]
MPGPLGGPATEGRLLDLALGGLEPAEAARLEAQVASQGGLRAEQERLVRLRAAAAALGEVAPPAGLSQRIALRVRDQVAGEERVARRQAQGVRWGLSLKARVRLLLASVAVHLLLLGWLVFVEDRDTPAPPRGRVDVAFVDPRERVAPEAGETFEPLDLGPVVAAEDIPDDLLVGVDLEAGAPEPQVRVAEYPQAVQFGMLARSRASVRAQRLARAGSALDTGSAVARGLAALAAQQRPDGSFTPDLTGGGSRLGPLGVTALACLPFLAEGRGSAGRLGEGRDAVVAPAVAWLRARLVAPVAPAAQAAQAAAGGSPSSDDLALGLLALSEDYMLTYGRLPPAEASARGREVAQVVRRLAALQRADGSFGGAPAASLWPLLALDAAAHTGLAVDVQDAGQRLARWIAAQPRTAEGLPAGAGGRADTALAAAEVLASRLPLERERVQRMAQALQGEAGEGAPSAGTLAGALALYRSDAPAFQRWNRAASEALLRRLGPAGSVLRGDLVADTALTLLALQAAYRLY